MRDATTVPEHELDHSRPSIAAPQDRRDSMQLQAATVGNAAFSGQVAHHPTRFRSSTPPLARHSGATLARLKGPLGGDSSKSMPVPVSPKKSIMPGDKGWTDKFAKEQLPDAAGTEVAEAYEQGQQLSSVPMNFKELDASIRRSNTSTRDKEHNERVASRLQIERVNEEDFVRQFNTNVPRCNAVLISMGRLKATKQSLGVPDFTTLTKEVVAGLEAAGPVAADLEEHGKAEQKKVVPDSRMSLKAQTNRVNDAKSEMRDAWLDVKGLMEKDLANTARAGGDKKRARVAEIGKDIAQLKQAGATVDLAMTTMGVGVTGKTDDGGLRTATSGSAGGRELSQEIDGEFSWGKATLPAGAKKVGGDAAEMMGLSLPTSASAILEDIGKLYYMKELGQLQAAIEVFDRMEKMHLGAAVHAETLAKRGRFRTAVNKFKNEVEQLKAARAERERDYMIFGQALDERAAGAAKGSDAAKAGPGKGKERFKLIMFVTALAREVLVNADAAIGGFGSAGPSAQLTEEINRMRDVPGWIAHYNLDGPPLKKVRNQMANFEKAVESFHNVLDPIDNAARSLLTTAVGTKSTPTDY